MKQGRDNYDLTAGEVLAQCQNSVPVGAKAASAIEAHRMAVYQRSADKVRWLAMTAVMLASGRTVEDDRAKLDYLASIPEADWPPSPAPLCGRKDATLDMLRRSIGWQVANA